MDAGPIVDAVSFLRGVASGERPVIGRRVAVYGGGNTAMDAARTARRLGAEEALIVYRRTREQMPAHEEEAQDAEREGVRINWLRTIKAFEGPELQVEVMELDESGFPQPTGRFETLAADTVILALGQETDTGFLRAVPGVEFERDGTVSVSSSLMTGLPGRVRGRGHGARRAHGDGRRGARQAGRAGDRRVAARRRSASGRRSTRRPRSSMLNLWYFGDAARRRQPELEPVRARRRLRRGGRRPLGRGGDVRGAPVPVVRELLRVRRLPRRLPGGRGDQARPGLRYRFDYDRCTGCRACFEQCPVHSIEMFPERALMRATVDGNEAAASVAYRLQRGLLHLPDHAVLADGRAGGRVVEPGQANVWGTVPSVVEMQSEAGAAGALHGALQGGALATTFTASQGLLLMIPNMYKIAGELTAAVLHVAARSLAAQGLSIFGDHSDVMAVRQTGFALLASASVQEAHDLALVAHAATLATRVPFVHFFDGFRTSHELNTIELLSDDDLRALRPGGAGPRAPRPGAVAGAAVHPRHRAEPGRLLPGARDRQPVLRPRARASCRTRWTSSASAPAATTGWSTTAGIPRPSGCSW